NVLPRGAESICVSFVRTLPPDLVGRSDVLTALFCRTVRRFLALTVRLGDTWPPDLVGRSHGSQRRSGLKLRLCSSPVSSHRKQVRRYSLARRSSSLRVKQPILVASIKPAFSNSRRTRAAVSLLQGISLARRRADNASCPLFMPL